MNYSSKYQIGQKVRLKVPFANASAEVEGIRFDRGTIRYDVVVTGTYNIERIYPDILDGEPNPIDYPDDLFPVDDDEEYYVIMNDIVMTDCRILGLYIFENANNELEYRYTIGYNPLRTVLKDVNSLYVFTKEQAQMLIRDNKIVQLNEQE